MLDRFALESELAAIEADLTNVVTTPMLNGLANVAAAFGIIQLNSTATLAIRLRRSSDNIECDFYFDETGRLVVADIMNFLAGYTGYISKWYDQSGNNNHAIQANTALQPYLAIEGNLIAVRYPFDGNNLTGFALPYTLSAAIDVQNTTVFSAYSCYQSMGLLGIGSPIGKRYLFCSQHAQLDLAINSNGTLVNGLELTSNGTPKQSNLFANTAANYFLVNSSPTGIRIDSNFKTANVAATASYMETEFQIGNSFTPGSGPFGGDLYCFIHFSASQSAGTITELINLSEQQFALVNPANSNLNVVFEGDSITAGSDAEDNKNYVSQLNSLKLQSALNFGVGGSTFVNLFARAAAIDTAITAGKTNIIFVWCGTNDFGAGRTAAQIYADTVTYAQARKTSGWNKVYVMTMLPRGQTNEANQAALNGLLLADTTNFDAVIDVGSDARFAVLHDTWPGGVDIYDFDHTYSSEGTHPTSAGYNVISSYVDPILEKLLNVSNTDLNIGLRLTNLENQFKSLSGSVILNTKVKQNASISLNNSAYFTGVYAENTSGGVLIIAGIDQSISESLSKSVTLIEPSGEGFFAVGKSTRPSSRWLFASPGGFGTSNTMFTIQDSNATTPQNYGLILSTLDDSTPNHADGYIYISRGTPGGTSADILEIGTPTKQIRIWAQAGAVSIIGSTLTISANTTIGGNLTINGQFALGTSTNQVQPIGSSVPTMKLTLYIGGVFYTIPLATT